MSQRIGAIWDLLNDHPDIGAVRCEDSENIVLTDYTSKPNRTATIPLSYIEAKLFVERKPPYDQ
jgi:hypothetical protein